MRNWEVRDLEVLRALLRRRHHLSGLYQEVSDIIHLTRRDDVSIRQLCERVEKNPVLVARVLRVGSAAAYGGRTVSSLNHAIAVLGLSATKSVLLSVALCNIFGDQARTAGFDGRAFLRRCLALGEISVLLAKKYGLQDPDALAVSGLLQDIGYLVLDEFAPTAFAAVISSASKLETEPVTSLEAHYVGFDHTQAGAIIAEEWHFDRSLYNAIRFHHTPASADRTYADVADLAHIASHVCGQIGLPVFPGCPPDVLDPYAMERLHAEAGESEELAKPVAEQVSKLELALFDREGES